MPYRKSTILALTLLAAALLVAVPIKAVEPVGGVDDGRPRTGEAEFGAATTDVDDFLRIFDTADDDRTQLFMESEFPDKSNWRMDNNNGDLQFIEFPGGTRLSFNMGGNVGIGTTSPSANLDIFRSAADPTNSAFRLTRGSSSWTTAHNAGGDYVLNKLGTGGAEFTVRERNDADATLVVQGHVRATSFKSSSSAALKTAFEVIDAADVLNGLLALPIHAWRYKSEAEGARHIGPMAEDFVRVFGLGDGTTLDSIDVNGVLMAAVQGMARLVHEQATQISDLEARLASLEARLDALAP